MDRKSDLVDTEKRKPDPFELEIIKNIEKAAELEERIAGGKKAPAEDKKK